MQYNFNKGHEISVVQGDDLDIAIDITIEDTQSEISKVYFICADLGIDEECRLVSTIDNVLNYACRIDKAQTSNFKVEVSDYDLKIIFIDGSVYTPVYKNSLIVKADKNKLGG